jgi:hypothetical protein
VFCSIPPGSDVYSVQIKTRHLKKICVYFFKNSSLCVNIATQFYENEVFLKTREKLSKESCEFWLQEEAGYSYQHCLTVGPGGGQSLGAVETLKVPSCRLHAGGRWECLGWVFEHLLKCVGLSGRAHQRDLRELLSPAWSVCLAAWGC